MAACSLLLLAVCVLAGCSTSVNYTPQPTASANVQATRTVALEVPTMECPFACWPAVQKTLESQPGVESVTLAEQKNENLIDNRVVHVAVGGGFEVESAIAALAEAGFADASVQTP
ncbi:MAG: heavy-metal-associated domain-containing protein [Pirellulaceae bacterium]|nr:heavy-metal-associated domain-containing protein [Pirellulaceae bacterium]